MTARAFAAACALLATVSVSWVSPALGEMRHRPGNDAEMEMHHLHILLNQGISMVAEGSNLVMLAGMQTTPDLDRPILHHGQRMIADGRDLVRRSLDGPEMAAVTAGGHAPAPLLRYSRELGEAIQRYMKRLERLDIDRMSSRRNLTLQRTNIALNHSLKMASDGANLAMIARMGMAGDVDRLALEQGERMISHARGLYREVMNGEAMKRLREMQGEAEPSGMIALTRELAESVSEIIERLARMPPPSPAAAGSGDVTGTPGRG